MNDTEIKLAINQTLDRLSRDQLAALLRIISLDIEKYPLKAKPFGAKTALIEVPQEIAVDVMSALRGMYPRFALDWGDDKTPLQKQIEETIERMTGSSHD